MEHTELEEPITERDMMGEGRRRWGWGVGVGGGVGWGGCSTISTFERRRLYLTVAAYLPAMMPI